MEAFVHVVEFNDMVGVGSVLEKMCIEFLEQARDQSAELETHKEMGVILLRSVSLERLVKHLKVTVIFFRLFATV